MKKLILGMLLLGACGGSELATDSVASPLAGDWYSAEKGVYAHSVVQSDGRITADLWTAADSWTFTGWYTESNRFLSGDLGHDGQAPVRVSGAFFDADPAGPNYFVMHRADGADPYPQIVLRRQH